MVEFEDSASSSPFGEGRMPTMVELTAIEAEDEVGTAAVEEERVTVPLTASSGSSDPPGETTTPTLPPVAVALATALLTTGVPA